MKIGDSNDEKSCIMNQPDGASDFSIKLGLVSANIGLDESRFAYIWCSSGAPPALETSSHWLKFVTMILGERPSPPIIS